MKTDKEERWAITVNDFKGKDRLILLFTIESTKSDSISKLLDFYTGIGKNCESRDAKWRAFKRHEDQFRAEKVVIQVADGAADEPEEPKRKRCCDNCIDLMRYTVRATGKSAIGCRQKNQPTGGNTIPTAEFVCDSHRFYEEVYPKG